MCLSVPCFTDRDAFFEKQHKKAKGQRVKHVYFWNGLYPGDIEDGVATVNRYNGWRMRKLARQIRAAKKASGDPDWAGKAAPGPQIPPGLAPDDAARVRRKFEKRRKHLEYEANRLRKQQAATMTKTATSQAASKRHKNDGNVALKSSSQTFMTSVSNAEFTATPAVIGAKNMNKKPDSKKSTEERTVKLKTWEFISDLVNNTETDTKHLKSVLFKSCEAHSQNGASQALNAHKPANSVARKKKHNKANRQQKPAKRNMVKFEDEKSTQFVKKRKKNGRKRKREKRRRQTQETTARLADDTVAATPNVQSTQNGSQSNVIVHKRPKSILKGRSGNGALPEKLTQAQKSPDEKTAELHKKLTSFSDLDFQPISVLVKSSSLRPSHLSTTYGTCYQEGHVSPRMFSLDISDKVKDAVAMFRFVQY